MKRISRIHKQPLKDDIRLPKDYIGKIRRMRPLPDRILVMLCYESHESLILPEVCQYPMESIVMAVPPENKKDLRIGDLVWHLHRSGFQIGFHDSDVVFRIVRMKYLLARKCKV